MRLGKKAGIWVFIDGRLYSWLGVPGMLWGRIVTEVYRYAKKGQAARRFCTWAATVLGVRSMLDITRDIKFDVRRLLRDFPGMVIVLVGHGGSYNMADGQVGGKG